MAYCRKCGRKLDYDSLFCSYCGAPIDLDPPRPQPDRTKRTQEYAGKIIKCPHCGETLGSFVTVCPSCGCEIRDAANSTAVEDFSRQIRMAYDDKEKIAIIRNFPIPNTKEDILEFAILASTNVDENANLDDEVSDAWFAKLGQASQKAQVTFPGQPECDRVVQLYNRVKEARTQAKQAHNSTKKKEKEYEAVKQGYQSADQEDASSQKGRATPNTLVAVGWMIAIIIIIIYCTDASITAEVILALVLVLGIFLIPPVCGSCRSSAPRTITVLGVIINLILIIIVTMDDVRSIWLLAVYIVCSVITLVRMFTYKRRR